MRQTGSLAEGAAVGVGVGLGVGVGGTGVDVGVAVGGTGVGVGGTGVGVGVAVGGTAVGVGVAMGGTDVGAGVAGGGTAVGVDVGMGASVGAGVGSPFPQAAMHRSIATPAAAMRIVLFNAPSAGMGLCRGYTYGRGYRGEKVLIVKLVSSSAMRSSWSMKRLVG